MATRKNKGSRRGTRKGGAWRMSQGKWKKVSPKLQSIHAEMREIAPMGQFTRKSASPQQQSYRSELGSPRSASFKSFSRKSSSKIPVGTRRNGYYRGYANNWISSPRWKKLHPYS